MNSAACLETPAQHGDGADGARLTLVRRGSSPPLGAQRRIVEGVNDARDLGADPYLPLNQ
jgi:hypothetical protein